MQQPLSVYCIQVMHVQHVTAKPQMAHCLCVNQMHVVVSLGNALRVGSKF